MADNEKKQKLLDIVRAAAQHDRALREKYGIGDKFRFIRDRLQALLSHVEKAVADLQENDSSVVTSLVEDETIIYVYLYNAHGLALEAWKKMLHPSVFYEYSVNRPVYSSESIIQSFIRSRANKAQHAYLAIIVKKQDVLTLPESSLKDTAGNPLIKVKEGSLKFNKLMGFYWNGHEYAVKENGEFLRKE